MSDDRLKNKRRSAPRPSASRPDPKRAIEKLVVEEIEVAAVGAGVGPSEAELRKLQRSSIWRRRMRALRFGISIAALALLAVFATLATRGFWPVDETRFLGIAWEMWSSGDRQVPRLNGVPVAQAPLFFWLVQGGWALFGVQEWWPRLLPGLLMVASLFVAARMARLLWPGEEPWYRRTPFVLLGGFYWLASATLFTPDFLTTLFTLLAVHALLWMWRTRDQRVWLLLGLWLGLGLLASGSLVLLYVLPIALLAPQWARGTPTMPWKYWYADLFKALLFGFGLFAAWFLPAAARVKSAAVMPVLSAPFSTHALDLYAGAHPWWWLLALLPVLAFPWSLWPLPWLRFWHIRREPISNGLAFCMLWGVVTIALLLLSPVSQPQLLLPLVPAFFLVTAWLVLDERHAGHDHSHLTSTMIFPLLLLGGTLAVLPKLPRVEFLPDFLWQLSPLVGVGVIGVGVVVGFLPLPSLEKRVTNIAAMVAVLSTLSLLALGWQFSAHYDLSEAAGKIAHAQQQGQAVAYVGRYTGQFHFGGRLQQPLQEVAPDAVESWSAENPTGLLVATADVWQPRQPVAVPPLHDQVYADSRLHLWPVAALLGAMPPPAEPAP
jgi:4-amino-4-deoxy-L-arabinose transferase-like glycosyltransferase